MRIVVNDKPSEPLTPAQWREISLWTKKDSFQGSMFSADEATRAYLSQTKWMYIIATSLFFALGCGLTLLVEPSGQPLMFIAMLGLTFLVAAYQFFMVRRKARIWNARMSGRLLGLTPSASKIGFDTEGLGVGDRVLPWSTLAIQQADFFRYSVTAPRGGTNTVYILERLSLTSPSGPVVLDAAMMGRGRLIVDNVWRRLASAPAPA
jgi:hypothetical protein